MSNIDCVSYSSLLERVRSSAIVGQPLYTVPMDVPILESSNNRSSSCATCNERMRGYRLAERLVEQENPRSECRTRRLLKLATTVYS